MTEENPTHESFAELVGLQDWSGTGRGFHVEFAAHERPPLTEGRFLGHGVNGGVYETVINGIRLAWKKTYCRKRIGPAERKEIEILKNLNHHHIIRLAGTYTHGQYLGMLLWPVALSDMATVFDDLTDVQSDDVWDRLDNLGFLKFVTVSVEDEIAKDTHIEPAMDTRIINGWFDCLIAAIEFLHANHIRHKDLKPSNILVGRMGKIWLTDFGSSTDFSLLSTSVTDGGERGTPKYFAPEVAAFQPSGRAADIFSLGCIFLEMLSMLVYFSLVQLKSCRSNLDGSYHANLSEIKAWLDDLSLDSPYSFQFQDAMRRVPMIRRMIDINPDRRPKAVEISTEFLSNCIGVPCSHAFAVDAEFHALQIKSLKAEISRLHREAFSNFVPGESEAHALRIHALRGLYDVGKKFRA